MTKMQNNDMANDNNIDNLMAEIKKNIDYKKKLQINNFYLKSKMVENCYFCVK